MFCSFLGIGLKKTIKPIFFFSVLFVFGVQVCFGQIKVKAGPQVINNDLFVTKTLSVATSPKALHYGQIPGAKLFVNGRMSSGTLGIGPWPANPKNYVFFGVGTLNQSDAKNYALLQGVEGSAKGRTYLNSPVDIRFRINNSDKMMLSNNGNVGIGTTNPGEKLTVVGECISINSSTASNRDRIKICTTYSGDRGPVNHNRNSISSNENLTLQSRTGFISMEAETGVVVGRGISVPQADLHVVGEIALTQVNVWDGKDENDLTWNGLKISREGSSRRYKKSIGPLKADFHKILGLEPKQYQMKEGFGEQDKWLFGYIAEDLDELGLKRLCNYDKDNRPDGIKYKKIAMYVLEIAKEQQKRINQLEESFKRMEKLLAEKLNTNEIKTQTPDKD